MPPLIKVLVTTDPYLIPNPVINTINVKKSNLLIKEINWGLLLFCIYLGIEIRI